MKRDIYNATTIGGHGYLHEHLPNLPNQKSDIIAGLETLRKITGEMPTSFSYPYGSYDSATLQLLPKLGITHAFTTKARPAILKKNRPYEITRVDIASFVK